nr:MAG TPA: hypothetical protein [Caudoviricetes sp.]
MKVGFIRHICKYLLLINQKHHIRVLIWDAATLGYNHILLFLSFNQAKIGYISSSFANVPSNHIHIKLQQLLLVLKNHCPFRTFYLSVDKRFHYLVQPDFATGGAGVNPDTRKHITRLRQTNITSRQIKANYLGLKTLL